MVVDSPFEMIPAKLKIYLTWQLAAPVASIGAFTWQRDCPIFQGELSVDTSAPQGVKGVFVVRQLVPTKI